MGRTIVKLAFERWGWTADIVHSDYGEDLDCSIFIDGRRTALHFRCQVKASQNPRRLRSGEFVVPVKATTCAAWLQSFYPVFLALYDAGADKAYVINATSWLRRHLEVLRSRSVPFRVPADRSLADCRDGLAQEVQNHYAGLLNLAASTLHCRAFPVLMPGYRTAPPAIPFEIEAWDWSQVSRHHLPAWTTFLKSLQDPWLPGIERAFTDASVGDAQKGVATALGLADDLENQGGRWLSFACAPVHFSTARSGGPSLWTGELTDWWSLARIGGQVVDDRSHAFRPPAGFVTEVARHARSWDHYYHVDPSRDLAIQLYASSPMAPARERRAATFHHYMTGHLEPWSCPPESVSALRDALERRELLFTLVPELSGESISRGVIHHPVFQVAPGFGVFPGVHAWEDYEGTVVRSVVADLPHDSLPGSNGPASIVDYLVRDVSEPTAHSIGESMGVEHDTPLGLPVDIGRRRILVERFHELATPVSESALTDRAAAAQARLSRAHPDLRDSELTFEVHDVELYRMARVALSWSPRLDESSADAFLKIESGLLEAFDTLLERRQGSGGKPHGTIDVLHFAGSLYFE